MVKNTLFSLHTRNVCGAIRRSAGLKHKRELFSKNIFSVSGGFLEFVKLSGIVFSAETYITSGSYGADGIGLVHRS